MIVILITKYFVKAFSMLHVIEQVGLGTLFQNVYQPILHCFHCQPKGGYRINVETASENPPLVSFVVLKPLQWDLDIEAFYLSGIQTGQSLNCINKSIALRGVDNPLDQ